MSAQILKHPSGQTHIASKEARGIVISYTKGCVAVFGSCDNRDDLADVIRVLKVIGQFLPSKHDDFPDGLWNVGQWK